MERLTSKTTPPTAPKTIENPDITRAKQLIGKFKARINQILGIPLQVNSPKLSDWHDLAGSIIAGFYQLTYAPPSVYYYSEFNKIMDNVLVILSTPGTEAQNSAIILPLLQGPKIFLPRASAAPSMAPPFSPLPFPPRAAAIASDLSPSLAGLAPVIAPPPPPPLPRPIAPSPSAGSSHVSAPMARLSLAAPPPVSSIDATVARFLDQGYILRPDRRTKLSLTELAAMPGMPPGLSAWGQIYWAFCHNLVTIYTSYNVIDPATAKPKPIGQHRSFDEILHLPIDPNPTRDQMEQIHNFIQLILPNESPTGNCPWAPLPSQADFHILSQDPRVKQKTTEAVITMFHYWTSGLPHTNPIVTHNNLRVIRAAKCALELGLELPSPILRFFFDALGSINQHLNRRTSTNPGDPIKFQEVEDLRSTIQVLLISLDGTPPRSSAPAAMSPTPSFTATSVVTTPDPPRPMIPPMASATPAPMVSAAPPLPPMPASIAPYRGFDFAEISGHDGTTQLFKFTVSVPPGTISGTQIPFGRIQKKVYADPSGKFYVKLSAPEIDSYLPSPPPPAPIVSAPAPRISAPLPGSLSMRSASPSAVPLAPSSAVLIRPASPMTMPNFDDLQVRSRITPQLLGALRSQASVLSPDGDLTPIGKRAFEGETSKYNAYQKAEFIITNLLKLDEHPESEVKLREYLDFYMRRGIRFAADPQLIFDHYRANPNYTYADFICDFIEVCLPDRLLTRGSTSDDGAAHRGFPPAQFMDFFMQMVPHVPHAAYEKTALINAIRTATKELLTKFHLASELAHTEGNLQPLLAFFQKGLSLGDPCFNAIYTDLADFDPAKSTETRTDYDRRTKLDYFTKKGPAVARDHPTEISDFQITFQQMNGSNATVKDLAKEVFLQLITEQFRSWAKTSGLPAARNGFDNDDWKVLEQQIAGDIADNGASSISTEPGLSFIRSTSMKKTVLDRATEAFIGPIARAYQSAPEFTSFPNELRVLIMANGNDLA